MTTKNRKKTQEKITTINDILANDGVNTVLESLNKNKANIQAIISVVVDNDGKIDLLYNVCSAEIVYLLEKAKYIAMISEGEDNS